MPGTMPGAEAPAAHARDHARGRGSPSPCQGPSPGLQPPPAHAREHPGAAAPAASTPHRAEYACSPKRGSQEGRSVGGSSEAWLSEAPTMVFCCSGCSIRACGLPQIRDEPRIGFYHVQQLKLTKEGPSVPWAGGPNAPCPTQHPAGLVGPMAPAPPSVQPGWRAGRPLPCPVSSRAGGPDAPAPPGTLPAA